MSRRYEGYEVDSAPAQVDIYTPQNVSTYISNDEFETEYALVIGNPWASAYAVTGSLADIKEWLVDTLATVHRFEQNAKEDQNGPQRDSAHSQGDCL